MLYSIYKISIKNSDWTYVGSTKNINNRIKSHQYNINLDETHKAHNYKIYKVIRENGGWDNCEVQVIETVECETKNDAHDKEQFWIDELKPNLNSVKSICHLTKSQRFKKYYDANHEKMLERRKEYYYNNPEKNK